MIKAKRTPGFVADVDLLCNARLIVLAVNSFDDMRAALVASVEAEKAEAAFHQHHRIVFFKDAFDRTTEDADETNRLSGIAKAAKEKALLLRAAALAKINQEK